MLYVTVKSWFEAHPPTPWLIVTTCPEMPASDAPVHVPGVTVMCPVGGVNPFAIVNVKSALPAEFAAKKVNIKVFPVLPAATSVFAGVTVNLVESGI